MGIEIFILIYWYKYKMFMIVLFVVDKKKIFGKLRILISREMVEYVLVYLCYVILFKIKRMSYNYMYCFRFIIRLKK